MASTTLSKYNSDIDVYQYYYIVEDTVKYGSYYLKGQDKRHIRKWTLTLQELGWKSVDRYIAHLKSMKFKEVQEIEDRHESESCTVS